MDLAYLREHPQQLPTFLVHQRIRETPVSGGSICQARRLTLEDGHSVFVKFVNDPTEKPATKEVPADFFMAEAAGLRWLAESGAVNVPEVIAVLPDLLALEWVDAAPPSPVAAERFGRELAAMHRAGAGDFGAPWPGFIGSLSQSNEGGVSWPEWFAANRLWPHLEASVRREALGIDDARLVERAINTLETCAPPAEPPARLHGDLWPGNLLWAADARVWLIDPSAHGGHRETDLAQLALFGSAPHLDRILAAYHEVAPLAEGWRARVPLHQLHLLLVHTALFGSAYRDAVVTTAQAAVDGAVR